MGNRLAAGAWSPKKRKKDAPRKATAVAKGDAVSSPKLTPRGGDVGGSEASPGRHVPSREAEEEDAPPPPSLWPRVAATVHAADALAAPVKEASERQRLEQQARDPALFFATHGAAASGDGDGDDVALRYAHALLVAADATRNAEALALLRPIAARPVAAPLAADARVHVAQCLLLLLDASKLTAMSVAEVETLLVESLRGDLDVELARQATELLAHVRLARGEVHGALELFDRAQPATAELAFQRACCQHLMGSDGSIEDYRGEQATTLLQTDAAALLVGPR